MVTTFTVKEAKNALRPRILLVEDNEINRKIVTLILKSHGMTCDVAKDGREAYMAVREKDYLMNYKVYCINNIAKRLIHL